MPGTITQLENDPRFRALSFRDQMEVKMKWAVSILQSDQRASAMTDDDKNSFVAAIVNRPPTFNIQQMDRTVQDWTRQWNAEGQMLENGQQLPYNSVTQGARSLLGSKLLDSVKFFKALDMVYIGIAEGLQKASNGDPNSFAGRAAALMNVDDFKQMENWLPWGDDQRKFRDYQEYVATSDPKRRPWAPEVQKMVGTAVGFGLDMAVGARLITPMMQGGVATTFLKDVLKGGADGAVARIMAKSTAKAVEIARASGTAAPELVNIGASQGALFASRVMASLGRVGAPALASVATGGALQTIRGQIEAYEAAPAADRPDWVIATDRIAKDFGSGAAFNFVIAGLGGFVWPFVKSVGKVLFKGVPAGTDAIKKMNWGELYQKSIDFLKSSAMPEETLANLSPVMRAHFEQADAVLKGVKNSAMVRTDPIVRTKTAAMVSGIIAKDAPDGSWTLMSMEDPTMMEHYSGLDTVTLRLEELQTKAIAELGEDGAAQFYAARQQGRMYSVSALESPLFEYNKAFSTTAHRADIKNPTLKENIRAAVEGGRNTYVDTSARPNVSSSEAQFIMDYANTQTSMRLMRLDLSDIDVDAIRNATPGEHSILNGRKIPVNATEVSPAAPVAPPEAPPSPTLTKGQRQAIIDAVPEAPMPPVQAVRITKRVVGGLPDYYAGDLLLTQEGGKGKWKIFEKQGDADRPIYTFKTQAEGAAKLRELAADQSKAMAKYEQTKATLRARNEAVAKAEQAAKAQYEEWYAKKRAPTVAAETVPSEANALVITNKIATMDKVNQASMAAERLMRQGVPGDATSLTKYVLLQSGYDSIAVTPDGSQVALLLPEHQIRVLDSRINMLTGKVSNVYKPNATLSSGGLEPVSELQVTFEGQVPGGRLSRQSLVMAMKGVSGKVNTDDLKTFARAYSTAARAPLGKLNIIPDESLRTDLSVLSEKRGDVIVIRVPDQVYGAESRSKVVKRFMEVLNLNIDKNAPVGINPDLLNPVDFTRSFNAKGMNDRYRLPGADIDTQRKWLMASLGEKGGAMDVEKTTGKITLKFKKSGFYVNEKFDSVEEALDAWVLYNTDERPLRLALMDEGGYRLVNQTNPFEKPLPGSRAKVKANYMVLDKSGAPVQGWTGESIPELLRNMGWRPTKLPETLAPKLAIIDPSLGKVRFTTNAVHGSNSSVMEYLNNFADNKRREVGRLMADFEAGSVKQFGTTFEAYIPQLEERRTFASLDEAKKFAKGEWKTYENIIKTAEARNMSVSFRNGKYQLLTDTGTVEFSNVEDLYKKVASVPAPEKAPIIEADMDAEHIIPSLEGKLSGMFIPERRMPIHVSPPVADHLNPKGHLEARAVLQPKFTYIREILTKTGNLELLQDCEDLDKLATIARSHQAEGAALADAVWNPSRAAGGKALKFGEMDIPYDRRLLIADWMESSDKAAFEKAHPLTSNEMRVAQWTREAFDIMFAKAGLKGSQFLENYLPHLRSELISRLKKDQAKFLPQGLAKHLNDIMTQGKYTSKTIDFFAKHSRKDPHAVADLILDRDPFSLYMRYNSIMNKQLYMEPALERLELRLTKGAGMQYPTGAVQDIMLWRDQLLGIDVTHSQAFLDNTHKNFANAIMDAARTAQMEGVEFKLDPKAVKDFRKATMDTGSWLYDMSYLSYMGWRPWLPVRNMHQVFQTLAPHFGFDPVMRAMTRVTKYTAEDYAKLRMGGFITESPQVYREIGKGQAIKQKLMKSGLGVFQSSDDWSRAVAYETAKIKFEEAMALKNQGVVKAPVDVLRMAEMDRLSPVVFRRAQAQMEAGEVAAAFDTVSREVVNMSNFRYRTSGKPFWNRGIAGRLFGKFGTYPIGYVDNVIGGFKNVYVNRSATEMIAGRGSGGIVPSSLRAAGFALRAVGAGVAMAKFYDSMGISGNDFLPWAPMQWSGGPEFYLFIRLINMFRSDYAGRQARSELDRFLPVNLSQGLQRVARGEDPQWKAQVPYGILPGATYLAKIKEAVEAYDQGNTQKAWVLAIGATPSPRLDEPW